jgi:hypothetical protein
MSTISWSDKIKKWRRNHEDDYAKALLSPPAKVTMASQIPFPGVILIMGKRRWGKTGLAHKIAEDAHNRKGLVAALHLPGITADIRKQVQKRVPPWMTVVSHRKDWPQKAVIIYDEAAQSAHARRSQSGDAVELDNLISISGQREQTIVFISHHSRKLDLNIVHEVDRIFWKSPTYAHAMFERDELSDFTYRAYEFFKRINGDVNKKKATYCVDFHNFTFTYFVNGLATWWSDDLSKVFERISTAMDRKNTP